METTQNKPGRPKLDAADVRSVQVIVRLRASEFAALQEAAKSPKYRNIQDFVRYWALRAAARQKGGKPSSSTGAMNGLDESTAGG